MAEERNIETFLEEVCFNPLLQIKLKYEGEGRITDEMVISPQQSKPSLSDLLSILNSPFYKPRLSSTENYVVSKIENIRINLVPGNSGHADIDFIIQEIQSAVLKLIDKGSDDLGCTNFKQHIEKTKIAFFPHLKKMEYDHLKDFQEDIRYVKKSTTKSKKILNLATAKKINRSGAVCKRMKTVDSILHKLHGQFIITTEKKLPEFFDQPPEAETVESKLRENHFVVITGYDNKVSLATALFAIKSIGFDRCVEMTKLSDWRHVDPEDVDLVLFRDPFKQNLDKKELVMVFDSMLYSAHNDEDFNNISVVIVSDREELKEWKLTNSHSLLDDVVTVEQSPTSETSPIDLTNDKNPNQGETHPILKNMIDQTDVFRKNIEKHTSFTETEDFLSAKSLFKKHKSVLILGKKSSGKTTLAVQLMSLFSPGQCLIITDPSEWKHARIGTISVVVIEDFAGKYSYDKKFASAWLTKFDQIYAAVLEGKINVIVTCGFNQFEKFMKRFSLHSLIEHQVRMTSEKFVKEEPMSPVSTLGDEQSCEMELLNVTEHDKNSAVADSTWSEDIMDTSPSEYCLDEFSTASWEKCLKEKSEDIAEYLITKNILPTKNQLSKIAITFEGGRKSSVMTKCCGKIIEHIKDMSEKIDGVYAAYTINELGKINIAFVICVKEDIDLRNRVTYEHKVRVLGKCNAETREVTFSKTNPKNKVSPNAAKMIKAFIEKNSKTLLQKHRMLSGISAGSIKSKNYGTSEWDKIPCPCIVFYVHAKHFIPIDEDPFEKEYEGFAVDVREGAFMRLGRKGHKSSDYQQNVKIAAEVSGNIGSGTLSGFLELKDSKDGFKMYGFTCAHVIMPHSLLKKNLDTSSNKTFDNQPENSDEVLASIVYQPSESGEVLGKVVKVAYEQGGNGTSGMEIALIELQKSRCPLSGKISDFADEIHEHTFEYGRVAGRMSVLNDEDVLKFGSASGISQGRIAFDGSIVRELTFPWQKDSLEIILHNQLEVWPINFQERFAKEGDSGAPVFVSRNDELFCLGIVEGGYDCGSCVVTPIDSFLRELGISSLKNFRKYPQEHAHGEGVQRNICKRKGKRKLGMVNEKGLT